MDGGGDAPRAALGVWGACAVLAVPTAVLLAIGPRHVAASDIFAGIGGASFVVLALTFASVGAVVARRVPRITIGMIFCLTGLMNLVQLFTWQYADVGLNGRYGLPGAAGANVVNSIIGEGTAGLLGLALVLVPDGRLPSPRWRAAPAALLAGIALLVIAGTFTPGPYASPFERQTNPFGIGGTGTAMGAVDLTGWLLVLAGFGLGAAAMIVRLRRARGIERQQIKLVVATGAVAGTGTLLLMCTWLIWPHGALQARIAVLGLVVATVPAATGVAILRYRLYDIDVAINRTLVYTTLTALLAATYLALTLVFSLALRPVTGSSGAAVQLSVLAVAALFRPARSRVQTLVDRRFYRHKFNAERILQAFTARMREQHDTDLLAAELTAAVAATMRPAHLHLWLAAHHPAGHHTRTSA